jgi:hypothetical protein
LVLEKNWSHDILKTILSSSQGNHIFIDWKIEIENLNVICTTLALTQALTRDQLKTQLPQTLPPGLLKLKNVMTTCEMPAHRNSPMLPWLTMWYAAVKRKTFSHDSLIHQPVGPHP